MPSPLRPRRVFWLAFALFAAMTVCWALATPIFSVPDENAHAVKAVAQVHGELIGHRIDGERQLVMDLPSGYSYSQQLLCFVFHPETPGNCGAELGEPGGALRASTWVSAYNPLYYYLVGWPSLLLNGSAGVYAMRIVSGVLGAVFFALAAMAGMASRRARWLPAGLAFAGLPMVVYLTGAVNPNGFEALSALALGVGLLRLLESFDTERFDPPRISRGTLWSVVAVSAVALANARALGPLWLVVVVALCFVATGWRSVRTLFSTRASYLPLALIAVAGVFSIGWTLVGGSLSGQAEKSDAPLVGAGILPAAAFMVRHTPAFLTQALGYFGWFDAPLPGQVFWPAIAALALVLALAFTSARRRDLVTLIVAVAVAALLPVAVQSYSAHQTGVIWQGRYGLFLYLAVLAIAGWVLSRRGGERIDFLAPRITWVVSALLWTFVNLAFVLVLRRYVIGNDVPIGGMFKDPQWQPPLGWIALVVLFAVCSAAFFSFIGVLSIPKTPIPAEPTLRREPAVLVETR